jgi:toxin ParE1/3/4
VTVLPRIDPQNEVRAIALAYAEVAGKTVALRFVAAFRATVDHIRAQPASGTPRFRDATGISTLRAWPLKGFPYLVFYLEEAEDVLILRVLHTSRDIPATLREG